MADWIYVDNSNVFIEGQRVSAVQAGIQLAHAALAYLAEREKISTVSLDRRDFSLIRLRSNRALKLIPELP